jgi:hypothetical protein
MSHEIYASVRVTLPDGPADMANALGEIATAWANFLAGFDQYSASSTVSFTVNETRSRAPATGAKRGRKPRKVWPELVAAGEEPAGEAA